MSFVCLGSLCAFKARLLKRVVYTPCLHILCFQPLLTHCHLVSAPYFTKIDLAKVTGEPLIANTRHTFQWCHTSVLCTLCHCWPYFMSLSGFHSFVTSSTYSFLYGPYCPSFSIQNTQQEDQEAHMQRGKTIYSSPYTN